MSKKGLRKNNSDSAVVVLAAGGTGGHVFPALALAAELKAQGLIPFFVTSEKDLHKSWTSTCPYPYVGLSSVPFQKSMAFGKKIYRSFRDGRKLLKNLKARLVLAFGSYVSLTPALAAYWQSIPLISLEQNVIPGKVTRLLNPLAKATLLQWEESAEHLWSQGKTRVLGNPLRSICTPWPRKKALSRLGLVQNKFTILVMGGSQGARSINGAIQKVLPLLKDQRKSIQWIHLCGKKDELSLRKTYRDCGFTHYVRDFEKNMGLLYGGSDLLISRSGGTTMAEATAVGLPMILIPYPHAAANHQMANGLAARDRGAAMVITEKDLHPNHLKNTLLSLLSGHKADEMAQASKGMGRPQAGSQIVQFILQTLRESENKESLR